MKHPLTSNQHYNKRSAEMDLSCKFAARRFSFLPLLRYFVVAYFSLAVIPGLRSQVNHAVEESGQAASTEVADPSSSQTQGLQILMSTVTIQHEGEKGSKLTWKTFKEFDTGRFVIENSQDGLGWAEVGSISGQGQSYMETDYSFIHSIAPAGDNYYRVRQYNSMGDSLATSNISFIRISYPQKFGLCHNITFECVEVFYPLQEQNVKIFDSFGGPAPIRYSKSADGLATFDVSQFIAGIYYLKVDDVVFRFVKQ